MTELTPFDLTPEQEAAARSADAEEREHRIDDLLPRFLSALSAALEPLFDQGWLDADGDRYIDEGFEARFAVDLKGLAREILGWVDDVRYDPYGNLETLERHAALFADLLAWQTTTVAVVPSVLIERLRRETGR